MDELDVDPPQGTVLEALRNGREQACFVIDDAKREYLLDLVRRDFEKAERKWGWLRDELQAWRRMRRNFCRWMWLIYWSG